MLGLSSLLHASHENVCARVEGLWTSIGLLRFSALRYNRPRAPMRQKRRAKPETYPREKRDDSVSRVAADDGDVHLANIKALLLGNEGVGAHNVESGDTCAWAQCIS